MEMLRKYNVDREDLRLIGKLCQRQVADIKIGKETTKEACRIMIGVRQGCPLSPRLFNLYAKEITQHRTFKKAGFKINGQIINNISYADDKVIIAKRPQELQRLVGRLFTESEKRAI
mgnify:CR=1 FL=1